MGSALSLYELHKDARERGPSWSLAISRRNAALRDPLEHGEAGAGIIAKAYDRRRWSIFDGDFDGVGIRPLPSRSLLRTNHDDGRGAWTEWRV
jgi:hypothetical protein